MTTALDEFITEARAISLEVAVEKVGAIVKGTGAEKVGPCPVCGGRDRFSVNYKKGLWFCRQADRGGDALALIAYRFGYSLEHRSGLLAACADLLGQPVPDGGEVESPDDREARQKRLRAQEAKRAADRAEREAEQGKFRQKEIDQARGIYFHSGSILMSIGERYLIERCGLTGGLNAGVSSHLRFSQSLSYWHGTDAAGRPQTVYSGPAMIAPFVTLDRKVVGCHQTWIDLGAKPKLRPLLMIDGHALPTKKMRGRKKGGLIPVFGSLAATRWVIGEGIETVLAIAGAEGFPESTFYCAAGDIGNIAGPADQSSSFSHPTLHKTDKRGRRIPVRVAGPVPLVGQDIEDALQLPDHVTEAVILIDGDSEIYFTASAIARAKQRLAREGLTISVWWPPAGLDFADALAAAAATMREVA